MSALSQNVIDPSAGKKDPSLWGKTSDLPSKSLLRFSRQIKQFVSRLRSRGRGYLSKECKK